MHRNPHDGDTILQSGQDSVIRMILRKVDRIPSLLLYIFPVRSGVSPAKLEMSRFHHFYLTHSTNVTVGRSSVIVIHLVIRKQEVKWHDLLKDISQSTWVATRCYASTPWWQIPKVAKHQGEWGAVHFANWLNQLPELTYWRHFNRIESPLIKIRSAAWGSGRFQGHIVYMIQWALLKTSWSFPTVEL